KEAIDHLKGVEDDRAIMLVSALLLENAVTACLTAFSPNFKDITEDFEISASVKEKTLKSLSVIPPQITAPLAPLRKIRNRFAHDLHVKTFDDVEARFFDALDSQRRLLLPNAPALPTRRETVVSTTHNVLLGLGMFRLHLALLRRYLIS